MKPCKRGHVSDRYVDGDCIQCAKARSQAWYRANTLRAKQNRKEYYQINKAIMNQQSILWIKNNPQRRKEICKKYNNANKEKVKEWWNRNREILLSKKRAYYIANSNWLNKNMAQYRKQNSARINAINAGRRARERNADGSFTVSDVDSLLIGQSGRCNLCTCELKTYHIDHIIPLAKGGNNYPSNLQLLCPLCNARKGVKILEAI